MRFSAPRIAALVLLSAALAAPAFAKFSLNDLDAADKKDIFEQATTLGAIEAQFEYCGFKTEIVARATRAVGACVTTESLREVIAAFRQSKAEMASSLQGEDVDCSDEARVKWLRTTKAAIDKYVENIARMCRNCLVC